MPAMIFINMRDTLRPIQNTSSTDIYIYIYIYSAFWPEKGEGKNYLLVDL